MINIDKYKDVAKLLADQSKEKLGDQEFNDFSNAFDRIVAEYYNKYRFYSTTIQLGKLKSFNEWLPSIAKDKTLLIPITVDKMVNEEDLFSLSLYKNLYAGTDLAPDNYLVPDVFDYYKAEYCGNGMGEQDLALIVGCYWVEQNSMTE